MVETRRRDACRLGFTILMPLAAAFQSSVFITQKGGGSCITMRRLKVFPFLVNARGKTVLAIRLCVGGRGRWYITETRAGKNTHNHPASSHHQPFLVDSGLVDRKDGDPTWVLF